MPTTAISSQQGIDAVVISTPDHWHAIIAIDAVRAGKDVYLQKPASLTIAEGRALGDAVHRSGRIFQIGAASDPNTITSVIGAGEVHLCESKDHHGNWLDCIKTRQQPIAPVEVAHRACSACLLHHIAMKTRRKLFWDPVRERFGNDDEANAMLSRPQRSPYVIS